MKYRSWILPAMMLASTAWAEHDMFDMDLQELMQIEVTISDRSREPASVSSSALTVITREDIRRSGIRTIPELMRLVPGFQVRQISGNLWAINSRRVPTRFADSMQVLLDGRTLYNPLFAGTYWDVQDTFIEDIERIELTRGPGSMAWGANAVTGVINIITRSAADTSGSVVYAGGGTGEIEHDAGARTTMAAGNGFLRIYGKDRKVADGVYGVGRGSTNAGFFPDGSDADDGVGSSQFGFRYDLSGGDDSHTLSGDLYDADANEVRIAAGTPVPGSIVARGYNLNYHSTLSITDMTSLDLQAYVDQNERHSGAFSEERNIYHVEGMSSWRFGQHAGTLGLQYRNIVDDSAPQVVGNGGFGLDPRSTNTETYSVLLQDRWTPVDTLSVLIGDRLEHNDYSGWESNPTLRAAYQFTPTSTLWGAVTRSVRTPSRSEAEAYLDFSNFNDSCSALGSRFLLDPELGCILSISSQDLEPVITLSHEVGYRQLVTPDLSAGLSLFHDRETSPLADRSGQTDRKAEYSGAELETSYRPSATWQLAGALSYLNENVGDTPTLASDRTELWSMKLRSEYHINPALNWNLLAYYDQGLPLRNQQGSFNDVTRLDTNLIWQFQPDWEARFVLSNLLDDRHFEAADSTKVNSEVRRGGMIIVTAYF